MPLGDRPEELGIKGDLAAIQPVEQRLKLLVGFDRPFMERIDDDFLAIPQVLDQKMTGKAHSVELEPNPPGDLHIEHREGDGNTLLTLQDLVQKTVPGIVVIVPVAAKSLLPKQYEVDRCNGSVRAQLLPTPGPDGRCDLIYAREIRINVQAGIVARSDRQSSAKQIDLFIRAANQPSEILGVIPGHTDGSVLSGLRNGVHKGRKFFLLHVLQRPLHGQTQILGSLNRTLGVHAKRLGHLGKVYRRVVHVGSDPGIFHFSFAEFGDLDPVLFRVIEGLVIVHDDEQRDPMLGRRPQRAGRHQQIAVRLNIDAQLSRLPQG